MRGLALSIVVAFVAVTGAGCLVQDQLNGGAARLSVLAAGQVLAFAGENPDCGLQSLSTLLFGVSDLALDDSGGMRATWNVDACEVGSDTLQTTNTDCVGDAIFAQGKAVVTATQVIDVGSLLPPALKDSHAARVTLASADVTELTTFAVEDGLGEPEAKITVHHGRISAEVEPALGESKSAPGTFSVPTPVARISHVRMQNASLTVVAEGQTLDLEVTDSDITAVSGPFDGKTNTIEGFIVANGERTEISGDLQPNFDLQKFDATYACTDDLAGPVR